MCNRSVVLSTTYVMFPSMYVNTAKTKDEEANRFTRHEVKNGLLAAMALCDSLKEAIKSDGKSFSQLDSSSSFSLESLASLSKHRKSLRTSGDEATQLRGPQRAVVELDSTLREILDTVLSEAMARDVIHEVYEPKMERVDVRRLLSSSHCSEADSRFPIVTNPNRFPVCILDPQLLKYIHRNAMSNAVKYGKKGGVVLTEVRYHESKKQLEMNVINLPRDDYGRILEMGEEAREAAFAPGRRLHSDFGPDGNDYLAFSSSRDGAWISRKCANTLGGDCDIRFEADRTVFTFRCPVSTFDLTKSLNLVNGTTLELPKNTVGIAIDDSRIQRKLMNKVFSLLGIPQNKQLVTGANCEEILEFSDVVMQMIKSDSAPYYLVIADENLDVMEDSAHHRTVSGSALIQKLRNDLGPELEKRMLALVRSANDSSADIALYLSRAHGFFPKAPVNREKIYELLAPLWVQRFPECAVDSSVGHAPTENELETCVSSAADLMQTVETIDALCNQDDALRPQKWPMIWDKLHILKGDLLCLQQSFLVSHTLRSIEMLHSPTVPDDLILKWRSIKALVEAILKV